MKGIVLLNKEIVLGKLPISEHSLSTDRMAHRDVRASEAYFAYTIDLDGRRVLLPDQIHDSLRETGRSIRKLLEVHSG